eukprot:13329-Heterococcus_DN1.PRE.4
MHVELMQTLRKQWAELQLAACSNEEALQQLWTGAHEPLQLDCNMQSKRTFVSSSASPSASSS